MFSTFQKNRELIGLLMGLFFLVCLHFSLYSSKKGYQDESLVVWAYATALLATGAEIGLMSFKNLLMRIACFLLLGPYIFILSIVIPFVMHGLSHPSVPYTGSEVYSNYRLYLVVFPFALSILLILGVFRAMEFIFSREARQ